MSEDGKKWYTIAEASEYFSMKKKTLYHRIYRNQFPKNAVLKMGRLIRLDVTAIEKANVLH